MKKLGVALVGLGSYSTYHLAPALQECKHCYLAGIVTGTPVKASMWSRRYQIERENIYNYTTFDTIAANDAIDIVYVALPTAMRAQFAIKAAEAGKHVICEKPMAATVTECIDIIEACNKNNVKLSVGYRLQYDPFHKYLETLQHDIHNPIIHIKGGFGFKFDAQQNWRLNEKKSGGALLDLGVYGVQAACSFLGKTPQKVSADKQSQSSGNVNGMTTFHLHFENNITTSFTTGYTDEINHLEIETKKGVITLENAFSFSNLKLSGIDTALDFEPVHQNQLFIDDFAVSILENKPVKVSGQMGLRDIRVMEAIHQALRTDTIVSIDF